jgi:hypothetical protein
MKDFLNEINNSFPIRRSDEEKASFFDYVLTELGGERVKKETIEKNNNIIIGNVSKASVVFTAHYDTPATSLIPNYMMPANKIIGTLIHLAYPLVMAIFSLIIAFLISGIFDLYQTATIVIYLVLYFGLFFCSTRLITNKNNKNDNTSGVATVLTLAKDLSSDKVAFILFDNEEKGLLGSKAYNKKYKRLMEDKLVINFDCVGNGDNMIFIFKDKAEQTMEYKLLREAIADGDDQFSVHYIPFKKSLGNSDHKSFPCSIGVMAANEGGFVRFITGRIHTSRDTVANIENIEFLYNRLSVFLNNI